MQLDLSVILTVLGIPSAVTALCFWAIQRNISKRDSKREALDNARARNEILLIHGVTAAIALGEATAKAIKTGECNGDMETALKYAEKVKDEQKDFLTELGIKNMF